MGGLLNIIPGLLDCRPAEDWPAASIGRLRGRVTANVATASDALQGWPAGDGAGQHSGRLWSGDGFGGSFNEVRDAASIVHHNEDAGEVAGLKHPAT
ncbi:hypothetical protein PQ455_02920 [Sphingomonas naphthae]|uniref:Uncharacterized protein n=1 Tax=Sphingomonas naphthae TaxID=1813468 RepID=A0ABY7TP77_9SPHN|nr:hypothetical protein [Sphingomonas naphthae]WCT74200.1 hypothetical protein PQ455_02920 [Sphingomonas naphthae]